MALQITRLNDYAYESGFNKDNIAIAEVVENPDVDYETIGCPPIRGSRIYFDPSDLQGEDIGNDDLVVLRVKKYRRLKWKGNLQPQIASVTHQYECIVEPYHSKETINGISGTISNSVSNGWIIVYEKDGRQCVVFPTNLDKSLKEEGLQVVFSGEVYKKTDYWDRVDEFEEIHRIRLTDISAMSE